MGRPRVLILDEPAALLSAEEVEKLWQILRHLAKQGVGIILIGHKLEDVLTIADQNYRPPSRPSRRYRFGRGGKCGAARRDDGRNTCCRGAKVVRLLREAGKLLPRLKCASFGRERPCAELVEGYQLLCQTRRECSA